MAKKTRTLFALLLVLVMVFTAGCTGKDTDQGGKETTSPSTTTENDTQSTEPSMDINIITEPTEDNETVPAQIVPDIAGTVLYDKNGIKLSTYGFETSDSGFSIQMLIENSSDRNVMVETSQFSCNGYMFGSGISAFLKPGTESVQSFSFANWQLEVQGITELSNIQFIFTVEDSDTWDLIDTSELLTLNVNEDFTPTYDYSGTEIYNQDGVRVICRGAGSASWCDGTVYFFIENNSGRNITVSGPWIQINGIATTSGFSGSLRDGAAIVSYIPMLDLSSCGLNSVDEIETLTFQLYVMEEKTNDLLDYTDYITIELNN